ncbi:MAG: HAD family hydrolase, partial [Chryseobacterium sp.]
MKDQNIQMVIFDMAGTTVNEDNLVYKTLQKSIK